MNKVILNTIIIQIFIIVLFIILTIFLIKQYVAAKLEKRFSPFSLQANNDDEISYADKILELVWKLNKKISKVLEKSVALRNYSKSYEKYINYEDRDKKASIDYISLKILVSLLFSFISFAIMSLKSVKYNFIGILLSFILGFFIPDLYLKIAFRKKRKRIEEDLAKAIIIMNNSFKAGRNIMQAINAVKIELDGPIADEFKKIYLDITYGLSLDVVFKRFYERVKLEDARYIASSLTLLNKTGGNIVKVFDTIEKSIYNRKKLRNELNSLTASSVFVFRFLITLPFIFTLVIFILNPTYFRPLFTSSLGLFFLSIIIILYVSYIIVIKKVLKVKI
jgi:tight adherence protein B